MHSNIGNRQLIYRITRKEKNKCVGRLARCKSHHTALRDADAPNSDCFAEPGHPFPTAH